MGFLIYAAFTEWRFGGVGKSQVARSVLIDIKQKEVESPPGAPRPQHKVPPKQHKQEKVRLTLQPQPPNVSPEQAKKADEKETPAILSASEGAQWLRVDPAWGSGGASGRGGMLHTGPQGPTQTFNEYIEALRSRGLDIVIVIDSTASMMSMMGEVKLKISNLALALRKLVPSCRIGIVTYRDRGEEEYLTKVQPLTYSISSLQRFLNPIKTEGGGDWREAVDAGLEAAIGHMNWNKKSKPFILLVGDAPPHKPDIARCIALAGKFRKEMGGTVSVLDVREPKEITGEQWDVMYKNKVPDPELQTHRYMTDPNFVDETFQRIAEAGGGESARLIHEEKLIRHMVLYIFGTQWEAYLTEIMKNL